MVRESTTVQVRMGGETGQGVILASVILAQAAAVDGRRIAQSARYGAAVRGGEATADVIVSDENIDYPHVESPDHLLLLSQPTYERLVPNLGGGALIIYDPFFVKPTSLDGVRQMELHATEMAIDNFGKGTNANLVFLGALTEIDEFISSESLARAVAEGVSKRFREANLKALELGRNAAREAAWKVCP